MKTKHLALDFDPPKQFEESQSYDYVRILKGISSTSNGGRALFIVDHMPSEDLESGKIFSGTTGQVFLNQLTYLESNYKLSTTIEDWNFLVVSFNMFKSYDLTDGQKADADISFAERIQEIICDYKPDYVLTFGPKPFRALNDKKIEYASGNYQNWYGVTIPTTAKHGKKKHRFTHVPNLSYETLLNPRTVTQASYLLGYQARCMLPLFQGGMKYAIPKVTVGKKRNWTLTYVTKMADVRKIIKRAVKERYVAIDTEATSLNIIKNTILSIQLSFDGNEAFVIPIYHRDSPFKGKELREMVTLLRDYFEENDNEFQIYTNAKFDLNLMRYQFGIRSYKANLWDIQAGQFAFDENLKFLATVVGKGYYSLANLSMQYGCTAYLDAEFGKEMRNTISDVDFDWTVQEYSGLDVIVPFRIFKQQIKIAKEIGFDKYRSIVSDQISDQLHTFSILESTGAYADIEYLFKLNLPNSPINQEIINVEKEFLTNPAVEEANDLICADDGVPEQGLFGAVSVSKFDLSKDEHKQILFFDVLGLKPLKESEKIRPNGKKAGKLDKDFQSAYKDIPIVSAYTKLGKAYKLRNAYVRSLLKLWGTSEDFKADQSIRPTYNYLRIVTGRTSASDPNLQQIPSRSEMGKLIKRILIARPGRLIIKVDYSAHEVRGWSIISGDKIVADVFERGADLRKRYRTVPDPWVKHLIAIEGDVHKINASYFFGVPIMEVTKQIRDSVKAVIFGLIYQQGDKGLAKSTGREVEDIVKIKGQFLDRFPVGYKWFDKIKKHSHEHYYVESPLGRRRHLWGYLIPDSHREANNVHNACDRRSVNSPVQGLGSDFMMTAIRLLDRMKYDYWKANGGEYPDFKLNVSVHDSVTVDCPYEWMFLAFDMIERSMTSAVVEVYRQRHGFVCTSVPEIDFEIGASEKDVKSWDFSYDHARSLIKKGLETKRDELGEHDLDVDKVLDEIMEDQYDQMSTWMKKQVWANDIKIRSRSKVNPLTNSDKKSIKDWFKELPNNIKLWAAYEAEEAAKKEAADKLAAKGIRPKVKIKISRALLRGALKRLRA